MEKDYGKTSLHSYRDTIERKIKHAPEIIKTTLPSSELWSDKNKTKPNMENLKKHFMREGKLEIEDALRIVELTEKILDKEPNLLKLDPPYTVCGDVHGQFFDVLKLFDIAGTPGKVNFLFLVNLFICLKKEEKCLIFFF